MKNKLFVFLVVVTLLGLLFHPSCKSEEACDFSILGTWIVNITVTGWGPWSETLIFSGSTASGAVTGWMYEPGHSGSYTVNNCNTVSFVFEYYGWFGYTYAPFNGTGTGNTMSGTMSYYDDDYGYTHNGTFTATKL